MSDINKLADDFNEQIIALLNFSIMKIKCKIDFMEYKKKINILKREDPKYLIEISYVEFIFNETKILEKDEEYFKEVKLDKKKILNLSFEDFKIDILFNRIKKKVATLDNNSKSQIWDIITNMLYLCKKYKELIPIKKN